MNIKEEFEKNRDKVMMRSTSNPDLWVLKYKRDVFYDASWNDFLRECRGLVVDGEFNIVSYPFTKIHNYGVEADAPEFDADELVFASRKVNGFMIACTWYQGDLLWSTTGTIDSDYVQYAKDIFNGWTDVEQRNFMNIIKEDSESTSMFECVHPDDPHIVAEQPGLYFIGTRLKDIGSPILLADEDFEKECWAGTGIRAVETYICPFSELQRMAQEVKHEGFVFNSADENSYLGVRARTSKIKSPHYLTKKALMRGNWNKFQSKQGLKMLDEEFFPLYRYINDVVKEEFFNLSEIDRCKFIEEWFTNGK